MEFIDEVVQKAQKAGKFISEKADATVDFVSLEYKMISLKGKRDSLYRDLGKLYFETCESECEEAEELTTLVDAVREVNDSLNALKEEMSKYKNVCPGCNSVNTANAVYCSKCGTKLK